MRDLYEIRITVEDQPPHPGWPRHSTVKLTSCVWDAAMWPDKFGLQPATAEAEVREAWTYTTGVIARTAVLMTVQLLTGVNAHGCGAGSAGCGLLGYSYMASQPVDWKERDSNPEARLLVPTEHRDWVVEECGRVIGHITQADEGGQLED